MANMSLQRSLSSAGAKANDRTTAFVSKPVSRDWLIDRIVNKLNKMMKTDGITMLRTSKNSTPQELLAAETQRLEYLQSLTPERLAEVTKIGTNSQRMMDAFKNGFFRVPNKTSPQRGTKRPERSPQSGTRSPPRLRQRVLQPGLNLEDIKGLLKGKIGGYNPKTKRRKPKSKTRLNYKR
jgi:hypothetical protein